MTIIEYLRKKTRVFSAAVSVALTLWVPTAGTGAPLPLTAEEISILKAGAAASKVSPIVLPKDVSDSHSLTVKLAYEGQTEALDLILSEGSDYLLNVYLNRADDRIPAAEIESRLRAYYDKPALAAQLLRVMKSYTSPATFHLLLDDLTPYATDHQHQAMYCKMVITMPRPDARPTAQNVYMGPNLALGVAEPNSVGAAAAPGLPGLPLRGYGTGSVSCRDERGQWQVQRSYMSQSEIQVKDRRGAALGAITRTDLQGIEADLLELVSPLSLAMGSETRGPDPAAVTIVPRRRTAPAPNILKTLAERGGEQAAQVLSALLQDLISQGPPYSTGDLSTLGGIVASTNTPQGSAAAKSALVAIAGTPETPQRNVEMQSLIKSLGEVRPPAQVDMAALRDWLTARVSVPEDKARISGALDLSIRTNAALREPNADYTAFLLRGTNAVSTQARFVIERIVDANLKTSGGETLLNVAAGNLEAQELLLARGADPNLPGVGGFTALHSQVAGPSLDGVRLLLAHGAKVNAVTADGSTPLHLALAHHQSAVARELIDAGADVNAAGQFGNRPLTIAYNLQNAEMQALIRERGGTETPRDHEERAQRAQLEKKYITRHYVIRTVLRPGRPACDVNQSLVLGRICQRLEIRDADEVAVLSPREMRLTYYSGKMLRDENVYPERLAREMLTAVVRDRDIVEIQQNLQIVDWRNAGCDLSRLRVGLPACWDEKARLCEKWGTREAELCDSRKLNN